MHLGAPNRLSTRASMRRSARPRRWAGIVLPALLGLLVFSPSRVPGQSAVPQRAADQPAAEPPTGKEKELLEKIRKLKAPRWRSFGSCQYDWTSWRLSEKGVRTTSFQCGEPPIKGNVAVYCPSLRISRRVADADWESWRLPLSVAESAATGGEDKMVANLCANARPQPNAASKAPAQPGAASTSKPKVTTPPLKPKSPAPAPAKPPAKPAAKPPAKQAP